MVFCCYKTYILLRPIHSIADIQDMWRLPIRCSGQQAKTETVEAGFFTAISKIRPWEPGLSRINAVKSGRETECSGQHVV